ncbi:MAG: GNAT family protein [Alphaproteobacteria bacterium]|nr:GNAT family protein [Alphaproteobacteria bacterium]
MSGTQDSKDIAAYARGDKAVLRAFAREDLGHYRRWLDDQQVTEFLEMGARPTRDKECDEFWRLANEADDAVVFAIVDPDSGQTVGVTGLYMIQWVCRRAQLNILVGDPDAWDKGIGTEATRMTVAYGFRRLNLESIQLGVNAENGRAIKAYEKVGFVHEGVRRRFLFCNGRYCDMVCMSILREEHERALTE